MKKILFVAGIALAGFSAAWAQEIKQNTQSQQGEVKQSRAVDNARMSRIDPETMAQRKTERLNKELSFTEEQKQKVHAVFLKEAQENKGRAVQHKETDEQLKAIFTAEQNQKYEALKERRKQAMTEGVVPARSAELKTAPSVGK